MSSLRERIVDAMVSAWNTGTPAGVPALVRSPFREVVLSDATPTSAEIEFLQGEEKPDSADMGPLQMHHDLFGIECRAQGSETDIPATLLDALYVWASKTFNRNTLSGLVDSLHVGGTQLVKQTEDRPYAKLLMVVECKYTSSAKDAEKRA